MGFDIQWSVATARQSTEWKGLAFRAMALALINMQERTLASQAVQELQAYLREGCQTSLASYKSTMNVKAAAGDSDIFYVIVRPVLREQDANVLQEELKHTFTSVVIGHRTQRKFACRLRHLRVRRHDRS